MTYPTITHWFVRNIDQDGIASILNYGASLHSRFNVKCYLLSLYHNFENDIWDIIRRDMKLKNLPDSIAIAERYKQEFRLHQYSLESIYDLKCLLTLYVIQQLAYNWFL